MLTHKPFSHMRSSGNLHVCTPMPAVRKPASLTRSATAYALKCVGDAAVASAAAAVGVVVSVGATAAAVAAAAVPATAVEGVSNFERMWQVMSLKCWRQEAFRTYTLKYRCIDRFFRRIAAADPGKKITIAWGDASFKASYRGVDGGAPVSAVRRRAEKHFAKVYAAGAKVEGEDEYCTSQACMFNPEHRLSAVYETKIDEDGKRVRRAVRGLKFCRTCIRLLNRDANGAANILFAYTERAAGRGRPKGLSREHKKVASKDIELAEAQKLSAAAHAKRHPAPNTLYARLSILFSAARPYRWCVPSVRVRVCG